jgi:hypothetical protein
LFEIEQGVPYDKPVNSSYPFHKMAVGDSFQFDGDSKAVQRIRSAANIYGKRNGMKFSVRKDNENFRVWRLE